MREARERRSQDLKTQIDKWFWRQPDSHQLHLAGKRSIECVAAIVATSMELMDAIFMRDGVQSANRERRASRCVLLLRGYLGSTNR
jgi:hypothetical protein